LRGGALFNALDRATGIGNVGGFYAVVTGTKAASTSTITGTTAAGLFTAGDQGSWTNNITRQVKAGTAPSTVSLTFTFPDAQTGRPVTVGGLGSAYDNLTTLSALKAVIAADNLLTPPPATGLPPILALTITTDGMPTIDASPVSFSGGTGNGSATPSYTEFKAALDQLDDIAFDLGHLVGGYDAQSQAYADLKAQSHAIFGYLKRFIHQIQVSGATQNGTKYANSTAVANAGIGAASALNSDRSSVVPQQVSYTDPNTGLTSFVDAAPLLCGLAAYVGANDQWGPASPLTHVYLPNVSDVDYPVLATTGDQDRAIQAGVWLLERIGLAAPGNVRSVQSVTTAPNDPSTGLPWLLSEFSVRRVADAVLANVKAAIETQRPRAIGGGNNTQQLAALISDVVNVLELAFDKQWLTSYDRNSIVINTSGSTGSDDLVAYAAAPTPPLNHIGVTQSLLPFQARLSLGGNVSG
jgi:hypothetical protein